MIEILGVLELEGRNSEIENIGDFLYVVLCTSSETTPGTYTEPLPSKCSGL